jgi:hypothetical protein
MSFHDPLEKRLIRNIQGEDLLEIFLVTAVAAMLSIRFFLAMTGYPKLGGEGLHIAHVLVGGAFMLFSIIILLNFLNKWSHYLAAVLGGFGFGAFIDELGKFVTSDNDYFFQPTVGLIYIAFILIYFLVKAINTSRWLSVEERLINVLEISKQAVLNDLSIREQQLAIDLLLGSDASSALTQDLRGFLLASHPIKEDIADRYSMLRQRASRLYAGLVEKKWFAEAIVAFFLLQALATLLVSLDLTVGLERALFWTAAAAVILLVYRSLRSKRSALIKVLCVLLFVLAIAIFVVSFLDLEMPELPLGDWLQIGFSVMAGLFAVAGVFRFRKNRLQGYNYFRNSILIYIFFVQIFTFFDIQFWGLLGLGFNVLTLGAIRFMISQERDRQFVFGPSAESLAAPR